MVIFYSAVFFRRKELASPNRLESVVSRESSFILNNWVFMVLLAVVFGFTMLPVFSESISGDRLTLGPHFFNEITGPLALILLFLTGVGPLVAWRKATPASLRRQFKWPVTLGLAATLALGTVFWGEVGYWALTTWGLCAFVAGTIGQEYAQAIGARMRIHGESVATAFMTLLRKNQRRYGGYIIHLGVVVMLLGISGSVFNYETLENMDPGDSVDVQDYRLEYLTADPITQQHYGGATARLALFRQERPLAVMEPEKRIYWLEDQPSTIPSIYSTWSEDIYVILNAIETDGSATVKIYRNPLVNWIWAGAILFAMGGISILWPHPPRSTTRQAA